MSEHGLPLTGPVEQVTWKDAQAFLARLNAKTPSATYRLPTEAEWEYACRAGSSEAAYGSADEIAWYGILQAGGTHPVATKKPNAWGLHDMLGNVSEWCQDWYGPYSGEPSLDPTGPPSGSFHVVRGSSFLADAPHTRAAVRSSGEPLKGYISFEGFRIVCASANAP